MQNLNEKVAVITGGASGIGLAVAKACAAEGMKLVLADIEAPKLEAVSAEFQSQNVDVLPLIVDVSNYAEVEDLAQQTLDRFGGVHFVFNNAGVGGGGTTTWETTLKDWEWTIGVNVMGVIHGIKVFTPIMLAQDEPGYIVNTASIAGLLTGPTMAAYRLSKHAVVSLSETLYFELEQMNANVGVSVLCPAWVKTEIHKSERIRPKSLANETAPDFESLSPLLQAQIMSASHAVENGISPDVVAQHVIEAIKENRFYILTHPEFTGAIAYRMKDILNGNNPRNLMNPKGK